MNLKKQRGRARLEKSHIGIVGMGGPKHVLSRYLNVS